MKLLIITQKVDRRDDVLGFFHTWIVEFAKHCERVTVICLQKGDYDLPDNVKVLSLGKENLRPLPPLASLAFGGTFDFRLLKKLKYSFNFLRHIWQERENYDAVFVHMNPVYIALAGPLWVAWRKKITLWYIHPKTGRFLKAAHLFAAVIFTASKGSFPFASPKVRAVGHGIDTELFRPMPDVVKEKNSVLYVGRITPIKRLEVLVEAVRLLKKQGTYLTLHLIGGPDVRYAEYYTQLKKDTADLEERGVVVYHGQIPNADMPKWYNKYEILVNVTPSGSFDKTVLEAMASGTLPVTSNSNFSSFVHPPFFVKEGDSNDLARSLKAIFSLSDEKKKEHAKTMRDTIVAEYNLEKLIVKITDALK